MENYIEMLEKLETIIARFHDLMGDEALLLLSEIGVSSSTNMQQAIGEISESERLLRIGIVGRVKAGKSSLLNALLFDGKDVLPKAATPMTAALTTLSYGDELAATVDFFSEEDIDDIRQRAQDFERQLAKLTEEKLAQQAKNKLVQEDVTLESERFEKAKKSARNQLKELNPVLYASYDQYCRMKQSGVSFKQLQQATKVTAGNYDELKTALLDYVSADGRYMPFTKSVDVQLPLETLEDVSVVDTPGVNDPVVSREDRTRELLKYCDVVLIVSPAGQFMTNEDLELMDRIGNKEGVRELYIVASQLDTQLFGSEKERFGGRLFDVQEGITQKLSEHLRVTIKNLQESNPETGKIYRQLLESDRCRVIPSSGICRTILECDGNIPRLDNGAVHVWKNLRQYYPDNFSSEDFLLSKESLSRMANVAALEQIIEDVRLKKAAILKQRAGDYLESCGKKIEKYKNELVNTARQKSQRLKNCTKDEIQKKIERNERLVEIVAPSLNETYKNEILNLCSSTKSAVSREIDNAYRHSRDDLEDGSDTVTKTGRREKEGFFNWIARKLWDGGYESFQYNVHTIRTGALREALDGFKEAFVIKLVESIEQSRTQWRKELLRECVKEIRSKLEDEGQIDIDLLEKAVRGAVSHLETPEIRFDDEVPKSLRARGTLSGSAAESFEEDARDYLRTLKGKYSNYVVNHLKELADKLSGVDLAKAVFNRHMKELEQLRIELENRKLTLKEYKRFEEEVGSV